MYSKLISNNIKVQTMIDILNCDIKQFNVLDENELDTRVDFIGDYGSEYTCSLREIQYTYKFCKKLLEMCRDAGYIK